MDYQIEIKQIVDYPRCRIYRSFFRDLMEDRNIRTNGSSYLFYYMVLCSFANFRSSNRRIEGISYLISPGEWICTLSDLSEWFRVRFQHQALAILDYLQTEHYISYCKLARGNLIKFTISDWKENNTWLEYNYPCAKDIEEIVESLRPHILNISRRTYYRKRPEAVEALSAVLWGYTNKDCLKVLNQFFPTNKPQL